MQPVALKTLEHSIKPLGDIAKNALSTPLYTFCLQKQIMSRTSLLFVVCVTRGIIIRAKNVSAFFEKNLILAT